MTLSQRFADATYRVYPRLTVGAGEQLASEAADGCLEDFAGRRHCTVVSFRRNGEPVATPVWFGVADERLYFRSLAGAAKLRRLRRNPELLIAPCTWRGRPTGPPLRARGRVLDEHEVVKAERAIQQNFGVGRRLYERAIGDAPAEYVEVVACGQGQPPAQGR